MSNDTNLKGFDEYKYGFSLPEEFVFKQDKGLDKDKIIQISKIKKEPEWMLNFRLQAYDIFKSKKLPTWGADISDLNFDDIVYYIKPVESQKKTWDELPESIKKTYDRLGIPEAERNFLAGVSAQYESEVVYHSLLNDLKEMGVIFTDMDTALQLYEDLVRKYFGKLVPPSDNKFAALNTCVWSGGSFVYVPKGVKVSIPLQAYFRINAKNMGQFERTLIIAEEDSYVHYIEGCFAPGALIKTKCGYKKIEELTNGDYVFTHNGRFKQVYRTMKRYYAGPIYKIKLSHNDLDICVTPQHPFLTRKRWQKNGIENVKWFLAEDLVQGDYLILPKHEIITNNFLERDLAIVSISKMSFGTVNKLNSDKRYFKSSTTNNLNYLLKGKEADKFITFNFDYLYWLLGLIFSGRVHFSSDQINIFANGLNINDLFPRLAKIFCINDISIWNSNLVSICCQEFIWWCNENLIYDGNRINLPSWIFELNYAQQASIWEGIKNSFANKNKIEIINSFDFVADMQLFLLKFDIKSRIYKVEENQWCLKVEENNFDLIIDGNYMLSKIKNIDVFYYEGFVYNLSVADDESYVAQCIVSHNCTAPVYSTDSLHSAVVEIYCLKGSRVRYTTIQNWSKNVYNLVTKRAIAYEKATMEWIDGNIGSKRTMKYPSIILKGKEAKGIVVSAAYAGEDQEQDTGTKIFHLAPNTSSEVIAKSVSQKNGLSTFRSIISVSPAAKNSKISVKCDALLLDNESKTKTIPVNIINQDDVQIEHEATVSRVKKIQLYYLLSRGFSEEEASSLIVNGFMDIFTRELPMEYAVELNRLISLKMEGSVG